MRWLDRTAAVLDFVAVISLLLVLFAASYQVTSRYILNFPLDWSETLARFSLIWLTFIGGATAFRRREHFALDTDLARKIPRSTRRRIRAGLLVIFGLFLLWAGWETTLASHNLWAPELGVKQSVAFVCVPISAFFIVVFGLELFLRTDDTVDAPSIEEPQI
jgi:TRAP-type C4-dicarboxylate transport system permease small subunit